MDYRKEIEEKENLILKLKQDIQLIRATNEEELMKPLRDKYVNKFIKIDGYHYMYVKNVEDYRHIKGIAVYSDCVFGEFSIEYDSLEDISDDYEIVDRLDFVGFVNQEVNKLLKELD